MHDSDNTYTLLERLGATKSKNEKLEILRGASQTDRNVMHRAMNPYITYGVAKVDIPKPGVNALAEGHIHMLDRLASRELSGNAAKLAIANAMGSLTAPSQEVLRRILIKDLRCGTGNTLINSVWPGLIPEFDVQLSEVYDQKRIKTWPAQFQRKLDGMRAVAVIDTYKGTVDFVSREGRPINTLDHLADILREKLDLFSHYEHNPIMLDGEATSGSFNDTVSQVKRKKGKAEDAVFNIFDIFYEHGNDDTQAARSALVAGIVAQYAHPAIGLVESHQVDSHEDIVRRVGEIWAAGGEGGMVKDLSMPYRRKRGFHWMKIKQKDSAEFEVLSVFRGTGAYADTAGGFVVRLENGGEGKVAGITEATRAAIWDNPTVIGRLIEVAFHERTPDGSFRHPRFVKFRDTLTGQKE